MTCDPGRLRAYADDALPLAERAAVAEHLASCSACQEGLVALRQRADLVSARLAALDPRPDTIPDAGKALVRFRAQASAARPSLWEAFRRNPALSKQTVFAARWRPVAVGLTLTLCLAILFSFAPVRQAAADFLGLFRVRKFAVIPLDQAQADRLEALLRQADSGTLGEPQVTRDVGPELPVADGAAAAALAGYRVRTPGWLPAGTELEKFTVRAGPAMHFELDRATLEALLLSAGARIGGLPQTEKIVLDVDVGSIVVEEYRMGRNRFQLLQVPSPAVDLPEGIDPVALAETSLLFLGMPVGDARRIASSIDWTSTLVIPLPSQAAQAREVTVDGVTGLLIEDIEGSFRNNALLWERDGILYFLTGTSMDERLLLDIADSLR